MTEYVRINRQYEVKWFPKIQSAIKSKVSSLISVVKDGGMNAGLRYLSTDMTNPELTSKVNDLYKEVGLRHARRNEIRLRSETRRKSVSIDLDQKRFGYSQEWVDFIQEYLKRFLIEKITFRVNETTRNELLDVMNEAIKEGWGISETVKHLEELPFTAIQAARIVRTEVNRAANTGVYAQGNSFEYELQKGWISVHDNRTRGVDPKDHADHIDMDGQWVDFYDVFRDPRNGVELQHPGDPKAPAGDTVNCRCNMTTRPKRNRNGRLIPKRRSTVVIYPNNRTQPVITI
jgi:hypothetical protein